MKIYYVLVTIFFIGCASSNIQTLRNIELIKQNSPVRLVEDKTFKSKKSTRYIEDWAGISSKSLIYNTYKEKTFDQLQKYCGYGKNELQS